MKGTAIQWASAAAAAEAERWQEIFSIVALAVAGVGFAAVVAYLLLRRNRDTYERAKRLPLEEDSRPR